MNDSTKNTFFLDIFNKILKVNNNEIIILYNKDGEPWFGLRDVIIALGYNDIKHFTNYIHIDTTNIKKYDDINKDIKHNVKNAQPHKKYVNESGLYQILASSTKPLAKIFMNEYFSNIMTQIRKTGKYIMDDKTNKLRQEMNNKLEENKQLVTNQRNVKYPEGNALYIIKQYYKIGYTSNLTKRLKSYNTGNANKILYNYFIMVENESIDKCIKKTMKNEELIKNKEFYKSRLSSIINFIIKCDSRIKTICCGYCLKCYTINKIKLHKCKYIN